MKEGMARAVAIRLMQKRDFSALRWGITARELAAEARVSVSIARKVLAQLVRDGVATRFLGSTRQGKAGKLAGTYPHEYRLRTDALERGERS